MDSNLEIVFYAKLTEESNKLKMRKSQTRLQVNSFSNEPKVWKQKFIKIQKTHKNKFFDENYC